MTVSPELAQAVNHLKTHAQQMDAIRVVADAIATVQDIERLAGEAHSNLVKIRTEVEEEKTLLANIKSDVEAERKRRKAEKEKVAEDIVAAQDRAKEIEKEAQRQAAKIIDGANSKATQIVDEANYKVEEIEAQRHGVELARDGLMEEVRQAHAEHAALLKKVEDAKKYLAKLVAEG